MHLCEFLDFEKLRYQKFTFAEMKGSILLILIISFKKQFLRHLLSIMLYSNGFTVR